jgi:hypothetical protein
MSKRKFDAGDHGGEKKSAKKTLGQLETPPYAKRVSFEWEWVEKRKKWGCLLARWVSNSHFGIAYGAVRLRLSFNGSAVTRTFSACSPALSLFFPWKTVYASIMGL